MVPIIDGGDGPIPGPPAGGRREPLLTQALQDEIVLHLASGAFYDEVAKAVGIGKSTFYNWLNRGRTAADKAATGRMLEPNEVTYMGFAQAVEKARATSTVHAHATIRSAMTRNWQAAAWYLERTNPARYGRWMRTAEEVPSTDDLEDAPSMAEEGDASGREAVIIYAQRWLQERGREAATITQGDGIDPETADDVAAEDDAAATP